MSSSLLFKLEGVGGYFYFLHSYFKSPYHYTVGLEIRERSSKGTTTIERSGNDGRNASEVVITEVYLDLLSWVECRKTWIGVVSVRRRNSMVVVPL